MTISSQTARTGPYAGNGATTVFAYNFRILDETHLVVTLTSSAGVDTVQTLSTHYTVSGVGAGAGGNVTMVTPPASGESLTISRDVPVTQETDYLNRGSFNPETTETALDKLTQICQDLLLITRRALLLPVTSSTLDLVLPTPTSDRVLGWNNAATALENKTPNSGGYLTVPGVSTDNAFPRFDGTSGTSFQNGQTVEDDSGNVVFAGDIRVADGDATDPGIGFSSDDDLGLFFKADGTIGITVAGTEIGTIAAGGIDLVTGLKFTVNGVDVSGSLTDPELTSIAALTSAANKIIRYTGSGTADLLDFKDEDNMASDSATALASQQSIKAYVDANVGGGISVVGAQALTSGPNKDFPISAGANRVTIIYDRLSASGTDEILVRLGDSGGFENSGYKSTSTNFSSSQTDTTGFLLNAGAAAATEFSGRFVMERIDGNTWICGGNTREEGSAVQYLNQGTKTLSAELTDVRIMLTGANSFDGASGKVNVFVE